MSLATRKTGENRPRPFLFPQLCKGCGRCIEACPKGCIELAEGLDPRTGMVPVEVDVELCNGCGLCFDACPEPWGLMPAPAEIPIGDDALDAVIGEAEAFRRAEPIPDHRVPLPPFGPTVMKGNHAAAAGALLAGCRHFFGYPITPSTEGAELMASVLPELGGRFVQAVSETATINMMYGAGGAGLRTMTFTSSPGLSLMLEGISYMIGAEIPGVIVNVMRGGPGLGNIGPEQSDIKLVCRGLGHGNTFAPVLAPGTPQEMLDLTMEAFELAMAWRTPVIVLGDGYLGQMTGKVHLPQTMVEPGLPDWAVWGDRGHRGNLLSSIYLAENDLEAHNEHLNRKYGRMTGLLQRADLHRCDDARWLIVACNTPGRIAKGAVRALRDAGIRAGLFRPLTLWPFPIEALAPLLAGVDGIVFVEAGPGQLEDEVRLAASHAGVSLPPRVESVRRLGGVLPRLDAIVETVTRLEEAHG